MSATSLPTSTTTPSSSAERADQAARSADDAIRSTQRAAHEALNGLSAKASEVREQAESLARRGMEAVRDSSTHLRERAVKASDTTVSYIRDEPVKSMLIAAATGAALMALVSLLGRSRRE
jgi:ElaB/YqjD/DUF883 family membrane-anchored ribosome-binding protein